MFRIALGAAVGLVFVLPAVAEDWTGKKVQMKEDAEPGRREGAGLVRGTEVVKKGTQLTVKADDGIYLELDGKLGTIFKSEALLASDDPDALPSDGTTWAEGTPLFLRDPHAHVQILTRSKDGLSATKRAWSPTDQPVVRKDGDDGTVLVWDGTVEGWVTKKYLVHLDDVPVWAERRLKANPKDSYTFWVRADALVLQQKYAEAEKDYSAAVQIDTKNQSLYYRRGQVRSSLRDLDGAIEDFTMALQLGPKSSWPALAYRGFCWLRKGEYQKADDDLTVWQEQNPKDTYWLVYRADARIRLGKAEKALADADASLESNPKDEYAFRVKARSLVRLKKHQDAKDIYEAGVELYPSQVLYANYSRFLATCPDKDFRDGTRAVLLMKLTQEAYGDRKETLPAEYLEVFAAAYAEVGDFEQAVEKQNEAIDKLKADKKTPAARLKQAEAVREQYREYKPLRDE